MVFLILDITLALFNNTEYGKVASMGANRESVCLIYR